jgi:hypothetical protein
MKPTTLEALGVSHTPQRLLATSTAAEFIGFSDSWLEKDRLKSQPLVPFVRVGRTVRYRLADLVAFVDGLSKAA